MVGIIGTMITGDSSAVQVSQDQPMKLAAMEGLYEGKQGADLIGFGILNPNKKWDDDQDAMLMEIRFPKGLSILSRHDPDAFVPGIKDIIEEGSESIINEDDYHFEFEDNTEIGKATVKIIANKINYKGMKKVTFNIIPTTGIQQFTVEELEGQWFDLNGQRIQNRPTQKGVYILRDKDGKVKKVRIK